MKQFLIVCLLLFSSLPVACGQISKTTLDQLMAHLGDKGFPAEYSEAESSIFAGKRVIIDLADEENIQIYIYQDARSMEQDASYISADGFSYSRPGTSSMIDWIDRPHFFKKGDLILLYVGGNQKLIQTLQEFAGTQFAGS